MKLAASQTKELLVLLQTRFVKHMHRHQGIHWQEIEDALQKNPAKLSGLWQMEESGGEPDVVVFDAEDTDIVFYDCATESPKGRRSLCFDDDALSARKENKPRGSAAKMAADMGIELLSETQYTRLQQLEDFDLKTSSWLQTPPEIRKLGGAIFGDKRFGRTFVYHNGAESYYAARGFRGIFRV